MTAQTKSTQAIPSSIFCNTKLNVRLAIRQGADLFGVNISANKLALLRVRALALAKPKSGTPFKCLPLT